MKLINDFYIGVPIVASDLHYLSNPLSIVINKIIISGKYNPKVLRETISYRYIIII